MKKKDYRKKYKLNPNISGKYGANMFNPIVQPDGKTEMGVPIPCEENLEYERETNEEIVL